jgi:CO dehydrogenase nickel-insertion accessory protein CooC1
MFGWAKYANTVCVVVEPTTKSLHAAERLLNLSNATWAPEHLVIVANKVADPTEIGRIEERLDRPVAASLPLDAALADVDRSGRPPLDVAPDGMFVRGVGALIEVVASLDYSDGMQVAP